MISTVLPDVATYTNKQLNLRNNVVIFSCTTEKYFYPEHKTPYLFLTNRISKGNYILNAKEIEASEKSFYLLNANDNLEIKFKSLPLQTLLILFTEKFVKECFYFSTSSAETLFNSSNELPNEEIYFPNIPFEFSAFLETKISKLFRSNMNKEELDISLFELLHEFFLINHDTQKRINKINAVKKSTKEELYRRLFLARELMHDMVFEYLTIDQISREVCLNKFHFLSAFNKLYSITPYQYYKEIKLQKAYDLLLQNQYSITEVCNKIGFESVGSFSNSFKKRFGISPSLVTTKK